MRTALKLGLLGLLAWVALAQQRGVVAPRGGQRPALRFPAGSSLPPVGPIPPLGTTWPIYPAQGQFLGRPGFGRRYVRPGGYYPYPYAFPTLFGGYAYTAPGQSNVVVVQVPAAPAEPEIVRPAAEPVKSDIRKYDWPEPPEREAPEEEAATFAIAFKDGSVESADAVWYQEGKLHYLTPEGEHRDVSLDRVDRERTEKLNREKRIPLRLPPVPGTRQSRS